MIFLVFYAIVTAVVFLIGAMKWRLTYWTRKGVYQIEPEFLFGNTRQMFVRTKSWGQHYLEFYRHFRSKGLRYGGIYMMPVPILLVVDLELIKTILLRDFDSFINHGVYVNEEAEPLTGHLFNLEDQKWRNLRVKLTPTFTSGKMKMMFQTFVACTDGLKEMIDEHIMMDNCVDIKDILARFTTDILASCAFGVECNSMKNPDSEFMIQGKKSFAITPRDAFMHMAANALPNKLTTYLGIRVIRPETEKFFFNMIKNTVEYREKHAIYRKDFMHLLLQLKNQGRVTDDANIDSNDSEKISALTLQELAAQCFVFFLAGHETTSSALTYSLFELASNPSIQNKLRLEINAVLEKHDNKVTYEAIMEMKYLEMVIFEALRKYPPFPVLIRLCTKPYKIPGSDLIIEKGRRVQFSVFGLHRDPEYYPEPEKFDPDRFSEENKATRHPFTWLPFGEGPRQCIGMRFGLLQTKVGLLTMIRNYKVSVNDKTKVPLELDPCNWLSSVKGNVWLNIEKV